MKIAFSLLCDYGSYAICAVASVCDTYRVKMCQRESGCLLSNPTTSTYVHSFQLSFIVVFFVYL